MGGGISDVGQQINKINQINAYWRKNVPTPKCLAGRIGETWWGGAQGGAQWKNVWAAGHMTGHIGQNLCVAEHMAGPLAFLRFWCSCASSLLEPPTFLVCVCVRTR